MTSGKTALITGGSRGIGRAVARKLAEMGMNIAIVYAGNQQAAEETLEMCRNAGVEARAWQLDVADFEAAKQTVAQVREAFGSIDVLVNNAGITQDGLVAMMKEADFDRVLDVDLKGVFNMIRHVAPVMIRQRSGRIVNVSSVSGIMGNAGQANYSAAKAGVIGLTKTVARELAVRGITVNAVAPGFIETDMTAAMTDAAREATLAMIPAGRLGQAQEVARAVAFLASDDAAYITGQVLAIDGGIAM